MFLTATALECWVGKGQRHDSVRNRPNGISVDQAYSVRFPPLGGAHVSPGGRAVRARLLVVVWSLWASVEHEQDGSLRDG
jgi:hypothetical protein